MDSGFFGAIARHMGDDVILLKLGVVGAFTTSAWYFLGLHPLLAIGPAMVATYGPLVACKALWPRKKYSPKAPGETLGPNSWMAR